MGEANCLRFQALLEIKETNHKLAFTKFDRALSIAKAIGDRFTQAFILMERAEPLLEVNQKLQAQDSLNQAISLFEAINRPDRAQQCREKLASLTTNVKENEK